MKHVLHVLLILSLATTACGEKVKDETTKENTTDNTETTDAATQTSVAATPSIIGEPSEALLSTQKNIEDYFVKNGDQDLQISQKQANCTAKKIVEAVGDDRILSLGSAEDLSERFVDLELEASERESVYNALIACIDFSLLLTESFTESGFSEEDYVCIANNAKQAGINETIASSIAQVANNSSDFPGGIAGMAEWITACDIDISQLNDS